MHPEDITPWAVDESGGGGDATAGAAQHQHPPPQQHTTIDLTGDDSDGDDGGGPAGKRQRVGGGSGGPGNSSSGGGGEAWLYEDTPMRLMAVRGLPARNNSGALGFDWRDLVREGPIIEAVVINFGIDVPYLLRACPALRDVPRVLFIHGHGVSEWQPPLVAAIEAVNAAGGGAWRWTEHFPPLLPRTGGVHHTKAFLLRYPEGVRIIIHSANLTKENMEDMTQSAFVLDFPSKDAASPRSSDFEHALRAYFARNELRPIDVALVEGLLSDHDFDSARAALVASAAGRFSGDLLHQFGHMRVRALLAAEPMPAAWRALPLVMQVTSLGSFEEKWLMEEVVPSLTAGRYAPAGYGGGGPAAAATPGPRLNASQVYLVWPTAAEVAAVNANAAAPGQQDNTGDSAVDAQQAAAPGQEDNTGDSALKRLAKVSQKFLQPLWARWGGAPAGREDDVAHLKTFLRFEPATKRIAWLLHGSHNLSIAAWGRLVKGGTQLNVPSYELGALSLPSLERAYQRHRHFGFCATTGAGASSAAAPQSMRFFAARQAGAEEIAAAGAAGAAPVLLPVPYTLPPERYGAGDKPCAC